MRKALLRLRGEMPMSKARKMHLKDSTHDVIQASTWGRLLFRFVSHLHVQHILILCWESVFAFFLWCKSAVETQKFDSSLVHCAAFFCSLAHCPVNLQLITQSSCYQLPHFSFHAVVAVTWADNVFNFRFFFGTFLLATIKVPNAHLKFQLFFRNFHTHLRIINFFPSSCAAVVVAI